MHARAQKCRKKNGDVENERVKMGDFIKKKTITHSKLREWLL